MLKIIHIIPSLRKGGAERLALDICNELSNRKNIQVKIVTFYRENDYLFLSQHIDWYVVFASVSLSKFKRNKFEVSNLQKIVEDFQPNIIHTHLFEAEIVSRSIFYPKAKWFSHVHDNMVQLENLQIFSLSNKKISNWYEKKYLAYRYSINGGNRFVTISKDTKSYMDRVFATYPVFLLSNAVQSDIFYKSRIYDTIDKLFIVNIGSFTSNKNQSFLIDIAVLLKEKEIDFRIQFLGEGELKKEVRAKTIALGLEDYISFLGNVDNVEDYLCKANICVHVARHESFGLVLLEAMAAGLPVITLDGKGNRDIIENGENGFMISEGNPTLFVDKILELKNNSKLYKAISQNAQRFAKQYDIKPYVDKLLDLYHNALKTL